MRDIRTVQTFDLVEAGAGNGRLAADILRAARGGSRVLRPTPAAPRRSQRRGARARKPRPSATSPTPAPRLAVTARVVRGRADRQRAARCAAGAPGRDARRRAARSVRRRRSTAVRREHEQAVPSVCDARRRSARRRRRWPTYLERLGVTLEPGWRVEINLRAVEWVRDAARRLRRGFMILIDYGHEARELYSATHAGGTLTTFARHHDGGPEQRRHDAAVAAAPGRAGHHGARRLHERPRRRRSRRAATLGFLDQTYFVLGSAGQSIASIRNPGTRESRSLKTL